MKDRRRWWIVWTLFFSTAINYINRQTLSVLAPVISKEFHLSHSELSNIFGSFQFAYAAAWLLGGIFLDIVGTRLGLTIAVIWWSIVSCVTSLAQSPVAFGALRFLLGIGEGFNWPGASKAVAEFFPETERGTAVAIFDSGSSVGGAIAAVAIPWIAPKTGLAGRVCVFGDAGIRLAGGVALCVSASEYADEGAAAAGPEAASQRYMAEYSKTPRDVGHRPRAFFHRSDLVVLCFLVAPIPQ